MFKLLQSLTQPLNLLFLITVYESEKREHFDLINLEAIKSLQEKLKKYISCAVQQLLERLLEAKSRNSIFFSNILCDRVTELSPKPTCRII